MLNLQCYIFNVLIVFENTVLRQIIGPKRENNEWRRRKSVELRELYNSPDIIATLKSRRLRWYGVWTIWTCCDAWK